jgi:23S rRNA pseudouridine1911/1915/1917 synthase
MVVHPSPGYTTGTLVNALLYHVKNLSSIGGVERPGIVHRLDKDTMGLMVVAKGDQVHRSLAEQFKERKVFKLYRAIVQGVVSWEHKVVESSIGRHPIDRKKFAIVEGGKYAKSEFFVKERFPNTMPRFLRLGSTREELTKSGCMSLLWGIPYWEIEPTALSRRVFQRKSLS